MPGFLLGVLVLRKDSTNSPGANLRKRSEPEGQSAGMRFATLTRACLGGVESAAGKLNQIGPLTGVHFATRRAMRCSSVSLS